MRVLTCSRHFPKGHPKAGEPTHFVEKIWNYFRQDDCSLPDSFIPFTNNYATLLSGNEYLKAMAVRDIKHHTIRAGNRWKPGDMASLRIWSDKPYRSKQVEFAQVEVKKVWQVEIKVKQTSPVIMINDKLLTYDAGCELAKNDGLSITDFISWFAMNHKNNCSQFTGQIISWSDAIDYVRPQKAIV